MAARATHMKGVAAMKERGKVGDRERVKGRGRGEERRIREEGG